MLAEPAPLFIDDADRVPDLVFRMGAVDEEAQAHGALLDPWIEDWLNVDPAREQGVGQGDAAFRIADDQDKAGSVEFEVQDQRATAGNIAAAACQRLAQRTHPNVDIIAGEAEIL